MSDTNKYLTIVLRSNGEAMDYLKIEAAIESIPGMRVSAMGWSHAFNERDAAEQKLREMTP